MMILDSWWHPLYSAYLCCQIAFQVNTSRVALSSYNKNTKYQHFFKLYFIYNFILIFFLLLLFHYIFVIDFIIHSFIHSFIHSSIHPFIHSFIHYINTIQYNTIQYNAIQHNTIHTDHSPVALYTRVIRLELCL